MIAALDSTPWDIAADAEMYGFSAAALAQKSSTLARAGAFVATSLLAINHAVDNLPAKGYKNISLLYLLGLIPIALFLHGNGYDSIRLPTDQLGLDSRQASSGHSQ